MCLKVQINKYLLKQMLKESTEILPPTRVVFVAVQFVSYRRRRSKKSCFKSVKGVLSTIKFPNSFKS